MWKPNANDGETVACLTMMQILEAIESQYSITKQSQFQWIVALKLLMPQAKLRSNSFGGVCVYVSMYVGPTRLRSLYVIP